ncbi:hypothetical protein DPEC_G00221040 [Dallia pectoralis]|uniref:Uncharacterized protein n=1 Tax=Dallia pectoralis TaxID=75939 RepID=A0ACC2G3Y9_DALPE|nr:hypothetical protein DPEC_G00221040 [Dallia pectoralis]
MTRACWPRCRTENPWKYVLEPSWVPQIVLQAEQLIQPDSFGLQSAKPSTLPIGERWSCGGRLGDWMHLWVEPARS